MFHEVRNRFLAARLRRRLSLYTSMALENEFCAEVQRNPEGVRFLTIRARDLVDELTQLSTRQKQIAHIKSMIAATAEFAARLDNAVSRHTSDRRDFTFRYCPQAMNEHEIDSTLAFRRNCFLSLTLLLSVMAAMEYERELRCSSSTLYSDASNLYWIIVEDEYSPIIGGYKEAFKRGDSLRPFHHELDRVHASMRVRDQAQQQAA